VKRKGEKVRKENKERGKENWNGIGNGQFNAVTYK
jgi:hypothetical protein